VVKEIVAFAVVSDGHKDLWNVDQFQRDYTTQYPRR
jgi:hypothetical protein